MESALWAGRRKKNEPARISLMAGFAPLAADGDASDGSFSYHVEIGLAPQHKAAFIDSQSASSCCCVQARAASEGRDTDVSSRRAAEKAARTTRPACESRRDEKGLRVDVGIDLMASETALGSLAESARFPDLELIRRTMLDWRFSARPANGSRSLPCGARAWQSPAQLSPRTGRTWPRCSRLWCTSDRTLQSLRRMIDDAFAGARLVVPPPERAASFGMIFPDYPQRVFDASELSDGTLRYLALAGTLHGVSPARIHRAKRARGEPASGSARSPGAPDCASFISYAGYG